MGSTQLLSLLVAALLVCAGTLAVAGTPVQGVAAEPTGSCSVVTVDAFRVSNTTLAELNETGSATVTTKNVEVTVEETDSFVRIRTSNPNGYCVRVTVELSSEVVTAAELGSVNAAQPEDSDVTADWRAMHSLADDELYTEVEFQAPAGVDGLLFAPSKLRVRSLSWTGRAEGEADTTGAKLKELLGMQEDLQQRTYTLSANQTGDVISVSLSSADGREVEEWHALYQGENGEWYPVEQDTDSVVFYTESEDMVKFHFNNETDVEFTADPTFRDKTRYEVQSYRGSLNRLLEGLRL